MPRLNDMNFIEEVRADRQPLAHVLKKHLGIRKIVEELYPDRAHFIYELLQNAEDTKATEVSFVLQEDKLTFNHNGRAFTDSDLLGITDIGEGTKAGDDDKIGRFGVGFKAVFAYSETPHIWSPTYNFKISELVLPTEIAPKPELGTKTRFEFPLNNPKKAPQDAFAEIKAGLEELAETTLLFLTNLQSIQWQIGSQPLGSVRRKPHSEYHIEILTQVNGGALKSSHFLRFSAPVQGVEKQHLFLAYELDFLPDFSAFNSAKPLSNQLRIIPANPGLVAVFFPAEKEVSGLRFHIHAPFITPIDRASVKDTVVNYPLYLQLGQLAATSLATIRDLGLLNTDFLAVLPNSQDALPNQYQIIRALIVAMMNEQPLTPTYSKTHAPAKHLLQAKSALKELLSESDLEYLVEYQDVAPQWAVAAQQKNSHADRFLSALAIKDWDVEQLTDLLFNKTSAEPRLVNLGMRQFWVRGVDKDFFVWLENKPAEWFQGLYAVIYTDLKVKSEWIHNRYVEELKQLLIIRLANGKHGLGAKCFFPGDGVVHDEVLPRVDAKVYTSGKSKTQQEEAKAFLGLMGVHAVGEVDQVKAILEHRYKGGDAFKPDLNDLERFVALLEKDKKQADIFSSYFIFKRTDSKWGKPDAVFLDSPIMETGLTAYFTALGKETNKAGLSDAYLQCTVPVDRLVKFAEVVGVQTRLQFETASCYNNPAVKELVYQSPGGWSGYYGINKDYVIKDIAEVLGLKNEALSRLMWKTACNEKDTNWLMASYRNNSHYNCRQELSQIACILKDTEWIPQTDGRFVRPSEASRDLLPKGFPYDEGYTWLTAIKFGEINKTQPKEVAHEIENAKALGFSDTQSLDRARRFTTLPTEEQERILSEHENKPVAEFPEKEPKQPVRRDEKISQQAKGAPERLVEERPRSVSVNRDKVKQEAEQYLRDQYTNPDGIMFCQICLKPLPFKLDDGLYHFEKVEFLPELKQHHYQNYLALCPNHSAMFKLANGSRSNLKQLFSQVEGSLLDITLANAIATIRFTRIHLGDLKEVIKTDAAPVEVNPSPAENTSARTPNEVASTKRLPNGMEECPYCHSPVRPDRLQSHIARVHSSGNRNLVSQVKLPPQIKESPTAFQKCRSCGKPTVPGEDYCYSCG